MNKTQIWENTLKILKQHKANEEMIKEFEALLAPKGKSIAFPPKLDEDGNVIELYCAWHKEYEPVDKFKYIQSKEKYHYECVDAEKEWAKYTKAIKATEKEIGEIVNQLLDGEMSQEEAKELRQTKLDLIETYKTNRLNKIDFKEA